VLVTSQYYKSTSYNEIGTLEQDYINSHVNYSSVVAQLQIVLVQARISDQEHFISWFVVLASWFDSHMSWIFRLCYLFGIWGHTAQLIPATIYCELHCGPLKFFGCTKNVFFSQIIVPPALYHKKALFRSIITAWLPSYSFHKYLNWEGNIGGMHAFCTDIYTWSFTIVFQTKLCFLLMYQYLCGLQVSKSCSFMIWEMDVFSLSPYTFSYMST
jgi:hypothetical protein